jgi:hypothetical protein
MSSNKVPSTIKVTNQHDHKDRYGLLSKGVLPANENHLAYLVSRYTEYANMYLNITNTSSLTAVVNFWLSDKTEPALEDMVEAEIVINAKETFVRGPLTASMLERVFLRTETEGLVYRIYGYDERKL